MSYFGGGAGGGYRPFGGNRMPPPSGSQFGLAPLIRPDGGFRGRGHNNFRGSYRSPRPNTARGGHRIPARGEVIRMGPSKPVPLIKKLDVSPSPSKQKPAEKVDVKNVEKVEIKKEPEKDKPKVEEKKETVVTPKTPEKMDVKTEKVVVKSEHSKILLDKYNSELHVKFDDNDLTGSIMRGAGFQYMWGGVRATHGVTKGKVCFEVHLLENLKVDLPDEKNPHVTRVGWSVDESDFQLGEDKLSWGYGGTGKSAYDSKFLDYGKSFSAGDVVTCFIDLDATPKAIFYMVNGAYLGVAFRFTNELGGKALYPHVTCKNMKFRVNFGGEPPKHKLTTGFCMMQSLPSDELTVPPAGPSKPEEAEVIMMVGLPACGKSYWCEKYAEQHRDKKYYILGTNFIIDRMKVSGLTRKRNYHGRWEELIKRASGVLNKLFDVAKKRPRNYILDQTNVYFTARRRKMESFRGYKKIAAVLINKPEVLETRTEKQKKAEGKIVPAEAIMEMKRNFTLPEVGPSFDDIWYLEEIQESARISVETYRSAGEDFKKSALKRPFPDVKSDEKKPRKEFQAPPNRGFQSTSELAKPHLMDVNTNNKVAAPKPYQRNNKNDDRNRTPNKPDEGTHTFANANNRDRHGVRPDNKNIIDQNAPRKDEYRDRSRDGRDAVRPDRRDDRDNTRPDRREDRDNTRPDKREDRERNDRGREPFRRDDRDRGLFNRDDRKDLPPRTEHRDEYMSPARGLPRENMREPPARLDERSYREQQVQYPRETPRDSMEDNLDQFQRTAPSPRRDHQIPFRDDQRSSSGHSDRRMPQEDRFHDRRSGSKEGNKDLPFSEHAIRKPIYPENSPRDSRLAPERSNSRDRYERINPRQDNSFTATERDRSSEYNRDPVAAVKTNEYGVANAYDRGREQDVRRFERDIPLNERNAPASDLVTQDRFNVRENRMQDPYYARDRAEQPYPAREPDRQTLPREREQQQMEDRNASFGIAPYLDRNKVEPEHYEQRKRDIYDRPAYSQDYPRDNQIRPADPEYRQPLQNRSLADSRVFDQGPIKRDYQNDPQTRSERPQPSAYFDRMDQGQPQDQFPYKEPYRQDPAKPLELPGTFPDRPKMEYALDSQNKPSPIERPYDQGRPIGDQSSSLDNQPGLSQFDRRPYEQQYGQDRFRPMEKERDISRLNPRDNIPSHHPSDQRYGSGCDYGRGPVSQTLTDNQYQYKAVNGTSRERDPYQQNSSHQQPTPARDPYSNDLPQRYNEQSLTAAPLRQPNLDYPPEQKPYEDAYSKPFAPRDTITTVPTTVSSVDYMYTSSSNSQIYSKPVDRASLSYQTQMTTSTANYHQQGYTNTPAQPHGNEQAQRVGDSNYSTQSTYSTAQSIADNRYPSQSANTQPPADNQYSNQQPSYGTALPPSIDNHYTNTESPYRNQPAYGGTPAAPNDRYASQSTYGAPQPAADDRYSRQPAYGTIQSATEDRYPKQPSYEGTPSITDNRYTSQPAYGHVQPSVQAPPPPQNVPTPGNSSTSYEQQQEDYQKAYSQWYANYAQAFAQLTQQK